MTGGGKIGNILVDPRYLATWLGISDKPPSAFLVVLMGISGSESVDELAILGDLGELLSFNLDFIGEFDMRVLTGSGEGVDEPSETDAVSGGVTDVDEFLDVGCGVTVRIGSCSAIRDDVGILSFRRTWETVDAMLISEFSFYNL